MNRIVISGNTRMIKGYIREVSVLANGCEPVYA
jgi:hypothetical protein